MIFSKNRKRLDPTFANINLLGKCNVNCYFCLGKELKDLSSGENQICTHFNEWKNFNDFLGICHSNRISKLYITGQNTDSLMYLHLKELIVHLRKYFSVGIRTNGYLAKKNLDVLNLCNLSVGYSVHSIIPETNYKIMGRRNIPDWVSIISKTNNPRIQIVVNRHNVGEIKSLLYAFSGFENVRYIQCRRISSDNRNNELHEDAVVYEKFYKEISRQYKQIGTYYNAQIFNIYGKPVCFWRTVKTSINSFNYFTDGTISTEYFIVEGYSKNKK